MPDTFSAVVAAAMKAERSRRGWEQDELGALMEWKRGTCSHIERGRRPLKLDEIPKLCSIFGIKFVELVRYAEPADREPFE